MWTTTLLALLPSVRALAPKGAWDAFNYAPTSRTVYPTAIHSTNGSVTDAERLVGGKGAITLSGAGSFVALDFGKEVGGLISLNFDTVSSSSSISLAFTESPLFIRPDASDDSSFPSANTTYDGVLSVPAPLHTGYWTQNSVMLRGGYRYLTIASTADASVTFSNVSCSISFSPSFDDLTAYAGYFYTQDDEFHDTDFLTKLWYAGAYTVQTDIVAVDTGRQVPIVPSPGWANNATLGLAGPIIVDGAKRDRAVWPGDMGIAVPTQFVSTNDLIPTRNALSTMFSNQNPVTGALPESGPPLSQLDSDTYHMWTLIGSYNYFLYSADTAWLQTIWHNYTFAVAFMAAKTEPSADGLVNITGLRDWARQGGGGINAEGNAIYYKLLTTATTLATALNDTALASAYAANASSIKTAFNDVFWLEDAGMYRDNATTTLCPQDANSMAVLFGLTDSTEKSVSVSQGLQKNWNDIGPIAPELPDTITPFISGFELQAHFTADQDATALDLLHRTWAYMLYTNISTQSTMLEGFTANGSLYYRSTDGYFWDPAYTSHSHGWSTAPTSALTFYVLGLQVTAPAGAAWSVAPHLSGLKTAQGGFETGLGWFGVKWTLSTKGKFELEIQAPEGTTGTVTIPSGVNGTTVQVNGDKPAPTVMASGGDVLQLPGGNYTITVE